MIIVPHLPSKHIGCMIRQKRPREEIWAPEKEYTQNIATTFVIETWFKVTVQMDKPEIEWIRYLHFIIFINTFSLLTKNYILYEFIR